MTTDTQWISRSGHDFNSSSKLSLRADCPGSSNLERIAEYSIDQLSTSNEAADRGKKMHEDGVMVLLGKVKIEDLDYSVEDKEQLRFVVDRTREIISRFDGTGAIVQYEVQIDLSELGISGGKHGCRIDVLIIIPGRGFVVIDWKFGKIWVEIPEYNYQIQSYSWGVWKKYGGNGEGIIIQPLSREGRDYMQCVFEEGDFEAIGARIKNIVSETKKPDAPLHRGPHCEKKFCWLRGSVCPLWKSTILEIPPGKTIGAYFESLSPASRGELKDRLEVIKHVTKHCLDVIEQLGVEHELPVNGWYIGNGKSSYVCSNLDTFKERLRPFVEAKGLTVEDLLIPPIEEQAKSKSDVEKILGKVKVVAEIIKSLYTVVPGKKVLKKSKF
ncbi:MAG: DUF2800 domain-containing protein [Chitinivibrionales bacterium]|nr:DUF2800 domain-containing protein [Chitinivibrionales bacterium]